MRRLGPALLGLLVGASTVACSGGVGSGTGSDGSPGQVSIAGSAQSPSVAGDRGWWLERPACEVAVPSGIVLNTLRVSPDQGVDYMAPVGGMNADGWIPFAKVRAARPGLAVWNIGTGEQKQLSTYTNESWSYSAFDGRYVLEKELVSDERRMEFSVRAHDLSSWASWAVGGNAPAPPGGPVPNTPLESFGLRDGLAWWIRGKDRTSTDVMISDLKTKETRVLLRGPYSGAHFIDGGLALTRLVSGENGWRDYVDLQGKPLVVPQRIADLRDRRWVAFGRDGGVAYLDEDWTEIYYLGPNDGTPSLIWQRPIETKAQNLPIMAAHGMVLPTMDGTTLYFDLTNGTVAKIADRLTAATLGSNVVVQTSGGGPRRNPSADENGGQTFSVFNVSPGTLGACPTRPPQLTPTSRFPITPTG